MRSLAYSEPFEQLRTGYAARAAKSKSAIVAGLRAFDFASLRSVRAVMSPTTGEGVYESRMV